MRISKLSHSAENVEADPLGFFEFWDFLINFVAKCQKQIEGAGPLETVRYFRKKSHSTKKIKRGII